jgi:hypothetical protein
MTLSMTSSHRNTAIFSDSDSQNLPPFFFRRSCVHPLLSVTPSRLDLVLFSPSIYPHSRSSHFRPTRHMADSYITHGSMQIVEMLTSPLVLLAPIHDATRGTARTWMRNYTASRWWEYLLRSRRLYGAIKPHGGGGCFGRRAVRCHLPTVLSIWGPSNHTFFLASDGTLHNA